MRIGQPASEERRQVRMQKFQAKSRAELSILPNSQVAGMIAANQAGLRGTPVFGNAARHTGLDNQLGADFIEMAPQPPARHHTSDAGISGDDYMGTSLIIMLF